MDRIFPFFGPWAVSLYTVFGSLTICLGAGSLQCESVARQGSSCFCNVWIYNGILRIGLRGVDRVATATFCGLVRAAMPTETYGPDPFFWTYIIVSILLVGLGLFLLTRQFWESRWLMEKINAPLAGKGLSFAPAADPALFVEMQTRQKLKFITQEQEANDIFNVSTAYGEHGIRAKCCRTSESSSWCHAVGGNLRLLDNADCSWAKVQAVLNLSSSTRIRVPYCVLSVSVLAGGRKVPERCRLQVRHWHGRAYTYMHNYNILYIYMLYTHTHLCVYMCICIVVYVYRLIYICIYMYVHIIFMYICIYRYTKHV